MSRFLRWCKRLGRRRHLFRAKATGSSFRLLDLPPDALGLTLTFLTGFDLLSLSHTTRELYSGMLARDAAIWQRLTPAQARLQPFQTRPPPTSLRSDGEPSAKQRYLTRRSIRFFGGPFPRSAGAIETPAMDTIAGGESFSFDLVFALMPKGAFTRIDTNGVILLGAQSTPVKSRIGFVSSVQYVCIDAERNLYCSVLSDKTVVAQRLTCERWYHVALVFDQTGPACGTQRVYVDGELVHTSQGMLHPGLSWLSYTQLGIGYDSTVGLRSRSQSLGWRPFSGLVDECRFWRGGLLHDEIRRLASGSSIDKAAHATVSWSVRDCAIEEVSGEVHIVRSTSPAERDVRNLKKTRRLPASSFENPRNDWVYISVDPPRNRAEFHPEVYP